MGSKHGHGSVWNIRACCTLKGTCNACAMTAHSSHSHDRKGECTNDNACSHHQKGTKHVCAFILGASVLGMTGPCLCAVTIMTGLLRSEHNYVTGPHGVKPYKRGGHSLWMWRSLHHEENTMDTSVNAVLPAAPNMRWWVNSLASLYWVRLSLLSSSLVLLWASDVAIFLSRSRLGFCSEVVTTVQCRLTCLHNDEPNLLRVSD